VPHRATLAATLLLFLSASIASAEPKPLFDGKTFAGWEGDTKTWRVGDGAIVGGSLDETVPRNEFLAAEREYGDFELTLKYKLVGTEGFVNGGIQFRSKRIPNDHEVIGYQADLGMGFDGALYDESRRRKMLAQPSPEVLAKALKKDDWNEYRIRAEGPHIRLWLNGVPTVDYTETDKDIPQKGIIALQIHGGAKAVVRYKDIVIEELSPKQASAADESGRWVSLFNGKDLTGWTPKIAGYEFGDNYKNTFRVEDGLLKVSYDGYDDFGVRFGHLFYKEKFSNYRFRVEYRFVGTQAPGGPGWAVRNSGVMFHCQAPEGMRKDQDFPVSIEAQMLGGDGTHERTTANVCTPGTNIVMDGKLITRHCTSSHSKTYHGDQWVTMELEVRGDRVRHFVNGEPVLEYEQPQLDPKDADAARLIRERNGEKLLREGYISLQSESHPVEFRKVEVMTLD
jgi:hypothetical protein